MNRFCNVFAELGLLCLLTSLSQAAELDYWVTDPELKVVKLDSAKTESFLAVKSDSAGQLFVGGRDALFVYDLDPQGQYLPRRELLRLPDHTWVYDIEIRGNDLYLLTVSALYIVPDGRVQREGLRAKRLIWGVPMGHVHQCFHGMTWGPDGKLYFAMGDPLWYYGDFSRPDHWGHWTFFCRPTILHDSIGTNGDEHGRASPYQSITVDDEKWERVPYNGVGGVFRCRPDGSGLEVIARGLRNSCGLCFDREWNLFTNDNDHESMPAEYVPGRLNHVTPGAYFNWPRGWMLNKTPERLDLLETMITTMGRAVPVGQSYYDDTFLPDTYRHSLLVARWCTRKVTYYPLRPHGATFRCEEKDLLIGGDLARPVHVSVGRGGRIFASICFMAQNEASPVYRSDLVMITRKDDSDTFPFEAYHAPQASLSALNKELLSPSWSRRFHAHVELQRRPPRPQSQQQFIAQNQNPNPNPNQKQTLELTANHWPWLAVANDPNWARAELPKMYLSQGDPLPANLRRQLIRVLGSNQTMMANNSLAAEATNKALSDEDLQVQHAAVIALSQVDTRVPESVMSRPALSEDTYIRQATALFLADRASIGRLLSMSQEVDDRLRLMGVLAAGFRLTLPPVHESIASDLPLVAWRNEDANLIQFADSTKKIDLRMLGRVGTYSIAEHWKAGKHDAEQEQLFALLQSRLTDQSERVRLQAAFFLSLLNDSRTEPTISKVRVASLQARLAVAPNSAINQLWVVGPFADEGKPFSVRHQPEIGPIDPAAEFETQGKKLTWQTLKPDGAHFNIRKLLGNCEQASSYAFTRLESSSKQTMRLLVGSDDGVKVWVNGKTVWENVVTRGALPFQDPILVDLQPGSNDLLLRVQNVTGETGCYLAYRTLGRVVHSLPEKLSGNTLAERLRSSTELVQAPLDPSFLTFDWATAGTKGNAERGRKLFSDKGLGCAKCHPIAHDDSVNAGPSLADAAKRFTANYLVESVLLPSKQVSPVFKASLIETKSGRSITGLVVSETADNLELILLDATRVTVPTSEVENRKFLDVSPMPVGLVKTVEELRDLMAFMLAN